MQDQGLHPNHIKGTNTNLVNIGNEVEHGGYHLNTSQYGKSLTNLREPNST